MVARRVARSAKRPPRRAPQSRGVLRRAPQPLTDAARWEAQRVKLRDWRERVAVAASMHGQPWKEGQLRYIDQLIMAHEANKPKQV